MGFEKRDVDRALAFPANDDSTKCVLWITSHNQAEQKEPNKQSGRRQLQNPFDLLDDDDVLPFESSEPPQRQNSAETMDMLKGLLLEDKRRGRSLSIPQHNFLYFDGYPEENQEFECIVCYDDFNLDGVRVLCCPFFDYDMKWCTFFLRFMCWSTVPTTAVCSAPKCTLNRR